MDGLTPRPGYGFLPPLAGRAPRAEGRIAVSVIHDCLG